MVHFDVKINIIKVVHPPTMAWQLDQGGVLYSSCLVMVLWSSLCQTFHILMLAWFLGMASVIYEGNYIAEEENLSPDSNFVQCLLCHIVYMVVQDLSQQVEDLPQQVVPEWELHCPASSWHQILWARHLLSALGYPSVLLL